MSTERTPRVWLRRLVYAVVPAALLVAVTASAIWGPNGLLEWQRLDTAKANAGDELAALQRENQRLLREMRLMDTDPVVMERLVSEELGWGRAGTTLVRFD